MALVKRVNAAGITTYMARIYIGEGRRANVSLGTEERKARAAYEELVTRYRRNEWRPVSDVRFGILARRWLVDHVATAYRATTQESYAHHIRNIWLPMLASRRVTTISTGELETWVSERRREGWSASRVRSAMLTLSSVLRYAVERGHLHANPVRKVALPSGRVRDARYLDADGLAWLLEGARRTGPMEYAIVALGATVGLRKGETLGLGLSQVLDLHTADARLVIERSSYRREVREAVKTESSRAVVPIGRIAREALEDWLVSRPDVDCDLVFCRADGRPLRDAWVNDALSRCLKTAGLDERAVDYHGLRHSCASLMAATNTPLRVAQALMRHHPASAGGVTAAVYQHAGDQQMRAASNAIDTAIDEAGDLPF